MATAKVPFSYDTILETIPRPIYNGKAGKTIVLTSIHVSNTVEENYSLFFEMVTLGHNTRGLLFSIDMIGGNFLIDDTKYKISPTSSIWAKSNKTTVAVVINGYEETVSP